MAANNKNPGIANINVPHFLDHLNLDEVETVNNTVLPLTSIILPKSQPRHYFDPQKLIQLTNSIKEHGILEPLLVRPLKKNTYELVAGERRYRAAQEAGLEEVPVIIRDLNDRKAYQLALVENLQREDLNPVEETEGILELLSMELDASIKEVISIIDQGLNAKKRNLSLTENVFSQVEKIESVLQSTSNMTIESFRTARLPLLNLPSEILIVLRQGKIEYTKARAIAQVKNEEQRGELLDIAINQSLSLTQIKELIKEFQFSKPKEIPPEKVTIQRVVNISKQIKSSKVWDDAKKLNKLDKLLDDIEKLLNCD
jgi:ParB family chromosome partitioning protein